MLMQKTTQRNRLTKQRTLPQKRGTKTLTLKQQLMERGYTGMQNAKVDEVGRMRQSTLVPNMREAKLSQGLVK